jgi:hypothetical protein
MPPVAQFVVLTYALSIGWLLLRALRARPALASLGLLLGILLILPNFVASGLASLRYSDLFVIGLAVALSAAPLFAWAPRRQRFARSLVWVAPALLAAGVYQSAQLAWPHHYLTKSARVADAVQDSVALSALVQPGRPVLLLSSFANSDAVWVFNATPSRLGSFFSANFGVPREQVAHFALDRLAGKSAILIDLYYRTRGGEAKVVAEVDEVRGAGKPVEANWRGGRWFDCASGNLIVITGRRLETSANDRQYIRVAFDGSDQAFNIVQLFAPLQESNRIGGVHEARVYALAPPGTDRCRVLPEGLDPGAAITEVQVVPLRR